MSVNQSWNGEIAGFGTGTSKAGKPYGVVKIRGDFEGEKEFKTFYPAKLDKFCVGQRVHIDIWEGSKQGDIMQNIELLETLTEQAMAKAGIPGPGKSPMGPYIQPACHDDLARRIWFGCCLNVTGQLYQAGGLLPKPELVAEYAQALFAKTKDFAGVA
jgi:hypothetical protein